MSVTYYNSLPSKLKSKSEKFQNHPKKVKIPEFQNPLENGHQQIIFSSVKIGVEYDGNIYRCWKCVVKDLFAILKHNQIFTVAREEKRERDRE